MSIGENIKQLRKLRNMTQKQLASKTGLAVITIQQYEAEKYNPKINALNKLCIALDCKITDLIDEDNKKYYRMFDNEKVTEKIDYDHSYSFASSEEEFNKLHQEHQIGIEKKHKSNIHKYDANINTEIEITPELIEISRIQNKILNDTKNVTEEEAKFYNDYYTSEQYKSLFKHLMETAQENLKSIKRLQTAYEALNEAGQEKVAEHAEMIAKIPEYQKKPPDHPQE